MASEEIIVFLDIEGNTINMIRGDGSDMKKLFTTGCVCPDGVGLDLSTYRKTKNVDDILLWWSNMGEKRPLRGEKDGGDWHAPDGFLARAPLFGGDAAVERVPMQAPRRLLRDRMEVMAPTGQPLVTTMKQIAVSSDGRAIFFCDREGHAVKKYNVDTKEVVSLISSDVLAALANGLSEEEAGSTRVEPNSVEDKLRFCVGIALDEKHNQIFFTIKGPSKAGMGRILAAPYNFQRRNLPSASAASTTAAEGLIDPKNVVTLLDHLPEPIDLLLDAEGKHLYWTDRGESSIGGNTLNRAPVIYDARANYPRLGDREILFTDFDEAIGLAWAASLEGRLPPNSDNKDSLRKHMYVTDVGHLWRCDLETSKKHALYRSGSNKMLTGVAVLRLPK